MPCDYLIFEIELTHKKQENKKTQTTFFSLPNDLISFTFLSSKLLRPEDIWGRTFSSC